MKIVTTLGIAAALALAGLATADAASFTVKYAHNSNTIKEDPQNVAAEYFKKTLEERSGGTLKVQLYPAGQLGDARTLAEGLQMGTVEVADIENGPMGNFVPEAAVWDLPFMFTSIEVAHKVLDGPIGQMIQKKYLDVGIRHMCYDDGGFRHFTNNRRPIVAPTDLEGLKIRVMESDVMVASMKAFGAAALPMSFGELYSALQQGVVDGQENPLNLIYSQRFYEVQKYLTLSGHFYYPRQVMVSEAFWSRLDKKQQEVLAATAKETCKVQRDTYATYAKTMAAELKDKGMAINELPLETKNVWAAAAREKVYPMFYQKIGRGDAAAGKALVEKTIDATK
ncbi:DctP family TRAP transporter solute-binding subunit [Rhodovulum sp. PH10]|uniref:DctP family TRAP transporter solute-binding subunit n=1 Tax=Rhodovulum sp. PH10 TaxID=1187851 RepID=UPI00058D5F66|nr:DctP family TRAP transporter solute-binding subunit [Rhodovulum sp. PH10]